MDSSLSQSVSIDGLKVRRVREEKRLTQLYVAKVVGVTTDTVSRWENNRYPTIRRENALNLADALEVELEEILKSEEEPDAGVDVGDPEQPPRRSPRTIAFAALAVLILIGCLLAWFNSKSVVEPQLSATRYLPAYAAPGAPILVHVQVHSETDFKGMILKEEFPPGWQLVESVPVASSVDEKAGGARWIFRRPGKVVDLYYLLKVNEGERSGDHATIAGEVIVNPEGRHVSVALKGDTSLQVQSLHWSDQNGDSVIDDLEILEVSDLLDKAEGVNIEWDLIEAIWEAEGYTWNPEKSQFAPLQKNNE